MPVVAQTFDLRRVLYVNTTANYGGGERCMLRLITALDHTRWQPLLACPEAGSLANAARAAGIPIVPLFAPEVFDPDALQDLSNTPRFLRWQRRARTGWNYGRVLPAAVRLARAIVQHEIDLVHANSPRAAMVAGVAARLTHRPVITHVRDIVHTPFASRFKRHLLTALSDRFVAASQATCDVIASMRPRSVVYDGLPSEVLARRPERSPLNQAAPHIGMVAFLSPWKGHEQLIRAAPTILKQYPGARFTLVGGDWNWQPLVAQRQHLEQLIARLGLQHHVTLLGTQDGTLDWLAHIDLFVHPPTAPDPFPGVVMEACIVGCPIVATAIGGIPELVRNRDSALLVPPDDASALAAAVLELLDAPALAMRLGMQAQHDVQQFTLDRTVAAVQNIYEGMIA